VVIHVVKAASAEFLKSGETAAFARVPRASGLVSERLMDEAGLLPKQARYQLRHTRISQVLYYRYLLFRNSFSLLMFFPCYGIIVPGVILQHENEKKTKSGSAYGTLFSHFTGKP
jgi:hypothetical protein